MVRVDYMELNTDLLRKCEEVLKKLSDVQSGLTSIFEYFQGCVDDGIIPPEELEKNLQSLHSFHSGIWELIERLRDYMGNIEGVECNIECLKKLVWKDKQIISRLECSINISEDLRVVLTDSINVAEYWCAQRWLNGEISPGIKSSVAVFLETYYDLVRLLNSLGVNIEQHFYECSELENSITMACVYAAPERTKANRYEEADRSEERPYPFLHAADDDLEDPFIM